MHVLHVGKYYPPYRGGIETVVEELCRALGQRGLRVSALVSNDSRRTEEEVVEGVHVIRLARQAILSSQPINRELVSSLRRIQCDVIHFHTPNPVGALSVLAARPKVPIVVSHHSDIVRQRVFGPPATAAQALLYRKAARLVAATPRHIQFSKLLRTFESRCAVIHYPIDPEPFASAPERWDAELPPSFEGRPLALFVGRLVYYKGLDVLLRALARVGDLNLAVVGTGPLEAALAAQAAELGVTDRVRFLRDVSRARLLSLYKCARFLVLPSVEPSEAFGMVQLEAMAASRAVISTDLESGVPYVNQHQRTGLVVPPRAPDALASAMRTLRDDAGYAAGLGAAGQRRVYAEFHRDRVFEQYLELYAALR